MIETITFILFWVGVTSVASALSFVPKHIRLYYVLIVLGNVLILLCSPLMLHWDFTIGVMTMVMISAQIKSGLDYRNERKWGRLNP